MHEEVLADRVQIAIGSLDEADRVAVDDHVWVSDQIGWFDVKDELPRHARSSDAVESKAEKNSSAEMAGLPIVRYPPI